MKPTRLLLPLALMTVLSPALADTPIDQTRPLDAKAHLSIENVKGSVRVTTWDRNQVHITGSLGDGVRKLAVDGDAHDLSIKVEGPNDSGWFNWGNDTHMGPTELNVQVPRGISLNVDVVSAPVGIDGLDGGKVEVNTVSGRVHASLRASPKVSVDSVSANIDLSGAVGDADLQTVSGDINAPQLGDIGKLETVSGDIRIGGGPFRKLSMNTVSGDIDVSGGLAPGGNIDVDSMSGDVGLNLPASLSATISASSFSGDLRSDFGHVVEHEHGPGSELKADVGGGHGTITLQTFSGDLRIRRQ